MQRCMRDCLHRGAVRPDQVDYISAHGTSTPVGDAAEAQAIYNVFGSRTPWVSSIKSMTGHEMWMSGASQVVYASLMAEKRFIAPNINFQKQEPNAAKINITAQAIDTNLKYILLNSAGFGGTNSCLLLEV